VPALQQRTPNSPTNLSPVPVIPGFDAFIISRFSPLSWVIPSSQTFKARDPSGRTLLAEIALMQQEILRKTGQSYVDALNYELQNMGVSDEDRQMYSMKLRGDAKGFKDFLIAFLGRG
jgi:exportin-T